MITVDRGSTSTIPVIWWGQNIKQQYLNISWYNAFLVFANAMYLRFFDKQILNMSSKLVEVFPNYVYVKKEFQRNYRSERVSHAGSCAVIRSSTGLHDYMVTWFCVNPLCRSMWLCSCVATLLHSYQWLIQDFPDGARAPTQKWVC